MATSISRPRRYASAHEGVGHWKLQRLTAVANVLLVLWFVVSAVGLSGAGYAEVQAWLGSTYNTTCMLLLIVSSFWHAKLGTQVWIEDYVAAAGPRLAALVALNLIVVALGMASVIAVLKVSLTG